MVTKTDDVVVTELGRTAVALTRQQVAELQKMKICDIAPTNEPGWWLLSAFKRVGVASLGDLTLTIRPKTPYSGLIFMASYSGTTVSLDDQAVSVDTERSLPTALARALITAVQRATSRGLLKGYREHSEQATVVRGRWAVGRQINRRPGLAVPVEVDFDDFTVDIIENQILLAALRLLIRASPPTAPVIRELRRCVDFFDGVSAWSGRNNDVVITRLNARYASALSIARLVLDAVSWRHASGSARSQTFLVDPASLFEAFVGKALAAMLAPSSLRVTTQERDWRLDTDGHVWMRPDIVIRSHGRILAVADTKYKLWGGNPGDVRNEDLYQALAYAVTAGVKEAHLIYVSSGVAPRPFSITGTGTRIVAHGVDIGGGPAELMREMKILAATVAYRRTAPVDASSSASDRT